VELHTGGSIESIVQAPEQGKVSFVADGEETVSAGNYRGEPETIAVIRASEGGDCRIQEIRESAVGLPIVQSSELEVNEW
jgi:hypothetical protein